MTGTSWVLVPETIKFNLTGKLPEGLGEKEALYFSVEGRGGTFDFVSFDLR